jgi:hypothetical protein
MKMLFAAVHESGSGTEGELRPLGSSGRNRRDFCRGSQAVGTRSVDPSRHLASISCCSKRSRVALSKCAFEPIHCRLGKLGVETRRWNFLGALGGGVAAWPLAASSQQAKPLVVV